MYIRARYLAAFCCVKRDACRTPASLWRDDPRTAGACRMARAVRCESGSDGIQRCLLEASLEHSGRTVHGSLGECAAHQECAWSQDRPVGRGMDCAVAAVWSSTAQLFTLRNQFAIYATSQESVRLYPTTPPP